MAIKAGLVGVNPKGVDHNGMPKGGETEKQLTANGKKFFFAYDETSEKYGYKLDGTGDFIPFESAGGGPGWVAPAELISEGLSVIGNHGSIEDGGYYVADGICYVDFIVKFSSQRTLSVVGFPKMVTGHTYYCAANTVTDEADINYFIDNNGTLVLDNPSDITTTRVQTPSKAVNTLLHVWGEYPIATT